MPLKFNPLVFGGFVPTGGGGGGEKGETGAKGEFNYLGTWSALTTYAKGDAVTEGGTTYASLKGANLNHKPTELGEWWAVIAEKGAEGVEGPKGAKGAKGEAGEFNFRGAWQPATAYAKGDAVTEGGSTYACIKAMTAGEDVAPPNVTFWTVIAEKGAKGETGLEGPKGTTGNEGPAGQGVPVGGTTGQVLAKKSNTNFDDEWVTPSGGAPSGPAGGDLEGTYPNPGIGAGKVVASKIGGEAVETGKIKLLAVTAAVLAEEAVTTAKIKLLAVTTATIADKAVTDPKLAGLTWTNVEAVNAKLEQTVTIQVAVFNGLVFMRGTGKTSAEIAAKGILFTLPAAMRPSAIRNITYNTSIGVATACLIIKVNGEVETTTLLAAGKTPAFDLVFPL